MTYSAFSAPLRMPTFSELFVSAAQQSSDGFGDEIDSFTNRLNKFKIDSENSSKSEINNFHDALFCPLSPAIKGPEAMEKPKPPPPLTPKELEGGILPPRAQNSLALSVDCPQITEDKESVEGDYVQLQQLILPEEHDFPNDDQQKQQQSKKRIESEQNSDGYGSLTADDLSSPFFSNFGIEIDLTKETIERLNNLFGDGSESRENTRLTVPLWLAEMLYCASQNMEIPEFMPGQDSDNDFPTGILEYQDMDYIPPEILMENYADPPPENRQRKNKKGKKLSEVIKLEFAPVNKGRILSSASNWAPYQKILKDLYCIFPDVSHEKIKNYAAANCYDIEATIRQIMGVLFNDKIPKEPEKEPDYFAFYVDSNMPDPIFLETKERELFPASEYIDEIGRDLFTQDHVDLLREEAVDLEEKKLHYYRMISENLKSDDKGICYHYISELKILNRTQRSRIYESDRIQMLINRDSNSIDLHYMTVDRAIQAIKNKINFCREKRPDLRKIQVITGYGRTTGCSVLKGVVINLLSKNRIGFSLLDGNPGVIEIRMPTVNKPIN